MKNKIQLYLILLLLVLIPLKVSAFEGKLVIECPSSAKKNTNITCDLKLIVTEGVATNVNATIVPDSGITVSNTNFSASVNGQDLGSISAKTKGESGTFKIDVENIEVTDSDGVTHRDLGQASASIKILSNSNSLSGIMIDGSTIAGFSSDSTSYTLEVNKSQIDIKAQKASDSSTISGDGKKNLTCGSNTFKLNVKAEDKSTKTYTLNIFRKCDDKTTLKGISISSGTLSPEFNPTTTLYKVKVSKDIKKFTIKAVKQDDSQVVAGEIFDKELVYGENKFVLKVKSEDGKTSSYTVIVTREEGRDKSTYLKSLKLDHGKIKFNKDVFKYDTKVLFEVTDVKVTAIPESNNAKVEIRGSQSLSLGKNKIIIKVTAENGDFKEYILNITRLKEGETLGDNPNVKSLKIDGYNIKFDPNKTVYELEIGKEKKLSFDIEMEDETSTYKIKGNKNLKNGSVIKIIGESEDGTVKTYNIKIKKSKALLLIIIGGICLLTGGGLIIMLIKNDKKSPVNVKPKKIKISKIEEEDLLTREALESKTPNNDNKKIEDSLEEDFEEYKPNDVKEVTVEDVPVSSTKVCSLCGHRIPSNAEVCPYCKKKFKNT